MRRFPTPSLLDVGVALVIIDMSLSQEDAKYQHMHTITDAR